MTRSVLCRAATCLLLAFALTACDARSDHAALNGTPDDWWSDNYFALLQDANEGNAAAASGNRPVVRMRLH